MVIPYIDAKKQDLYFVQTVRGGFLWVHQEIDRHSQAKLDRKSRGMVVHPYERDFKSMVSNNMVQNCPITGSGVTNAHTIFVPNLAGTGVKTVR